MSILKRTHLAFLFFFLPSLSLFGQWFPANSGTTSALNGGYLLDSGTGFIVGEAGTILKTTDAGMTWAALTSGTAETLHDVYFFNADQGVAVGDNGLILRTTDGGAIWQSVPSGVTDSLRAVSFSGANGICGGTSQTILYSTDSGVSWNVGQTGFFGGGFFGAHMLSPTLGFVAGQNSIFGPLVGATVDGGVTWTFHAFYFEGNEGSCADIFFFDGATGVVSGIVWDGRGAIARTNNGGTDWTTSFYDQGMQGIDFPRTDSGFAVGWAGRILHTEDSGISWVEQTSGTSADLNDVAFAGDALRGIAVGEGGIILRTTNGGAPTPTPLSAVSRKIHGGAGTFDVPLPLTGNVGIECRSGGGTNDYQLIIDFAKPVTVGGASVTSGTGKVSSFSVSGSEVTVNLTGVTNAQRITVTLSDVNDGTNTGDVPVSMGVLVGDANDNALTNADDVSLTKSQAGQTVTSANFREDVNANSAINASDVSLVKAQSGTALP